MVVRMEEFVGGGEGELSVSTVLDKDAPLERVRGQAPCPRTSVDEAVE